MTYWRATRGLNERAPVGNPATVADQLPVVTANTPIPTLPREFFFELAQPEASPEDMEFGALSFAFACFVSPILVGGLILLVMFVLV